MTMRVLMTADALGGVWTYALELADALAPYDVEVHLATMGRRLSEEHHGELKRSAVAQVYESDFRLEWQDDPWPDVERAGEWLLELEATVQPDLIHLNGFVHGALPWRAPVVVVGHSDVLSWWQAVRGGPVPRQWDTYRDRVTAGLMAADVVVAPTEHALSGLREGYGISEGHVIANCRRDDWVRFVVKEPLVLGAGRVWDEAKNLAALHQVAAALPWPTVIAGPRTAPDAERHGTSRLGGGGTTTRFLGELPFDDLAERLLRASIFVLPAKYEPFGLGPLEAAQAGCALVLGDIPSLREVWGDAAVFIDPCSPNELEKALLHLIDHPRQLHRLRACARERARSYRPARTAGAYLDLYQHLPVRAGGAR